MLTSNAWITFTYKRPTCSFHQKRIKLSIDSVLWLPLRLISTDLFFSHGWHEFIRILHPEWTFSPKRYGGNKILKNKTENLLRRAFIYHTSNMHSICWQHHPRMAIYSCKRHISTLLNNEQGNDLNRGKWMYNQTGKIYIKYSIYHLQVELSFPNSYWWL